MLSGNDRPLGFAPAGGYPRQRIGNFNQMIQSPADREGAYIDSPVAALPAPERQYSSVVNRAKRHMAFGQNKMESPNRVNFLERRIMKMKADIITAPERKVLHGNQLATSLEGLNPNQLSKQQRSKGVASRLSFGEIMRMRMRRPR